MIQHYVHLKTSLSIGTGACITAILLLCQVKLAIMFGVRQADLFNCS